MPLAREGVRVVLCARREALLAEARNTIAKETGAGGWRCRAMFNNCLTSGDWSRRQRNDLGAIHILVNNAGGVPHAVHRRGRCEPGIKCWRKLLNYIRVTREVASYIQKAGWGRIVSISREPRRMAAPSSTAMAVGLTQCRGDQLDKIHVSPVCGLTAF